jgi:hypothetical protein
MKPIKQTKKGSVTEKGWVAKNTKFKREHCATVIEYGKKGKSIAQFCASLEISRSTFNDWAAVHSEFEEAKRISIEACKGYWDTQVDAYIVESYEGDKLNATHLKYVASERFPQRQPIKLRDSSNLLKCMEDVLNAVSKGEISADDANKYGALLKTAADIEQHTKMHNDIEELKRIVAQNNAERFGESEGLIEEGNIP